MHNQLCRQSICSICSVCNRRVSNDCIASNVSSDVSIVSNVSIVDNISIVRNVSSVSNSSVSSLCNRKKNVNIKNYLNKNICTEKKTITKFSILIGYQQPNLSFNWTVAHVMLVIGL